MRRPATILSAPPLAVLVVLTALATHVLADEQKPSCVDDAMLVFDASGSMAATDFPKALPRAWTAYGKPC